MWRIILFLLTYYVAPPSQPSAPALENVGVTWVHISWTAPLMADSPVSHYEIIAREVDGRGVVTVTTTTNVTFYNVTGLFPGTTYELTVVAVSEDGNVTARSPESDSVSTAATRPGIIRQHIIAYYSWIS